MFSVSNKRYIYIAVYFLLALLCAPTNLLHFDSYYYWDWSRHLALSYYDGPPMIAYFIKASTLIFGDTLLALSIVGIAVCALTSFLVYKTAKLFLSKEASYIAMMGWTFSPAIYLDLLKQTTYDAPLTLFWASTVYFIVRFCACNKTKVTTLPSSPKSRGDDGRHEQLQTRDLYLAAISIGLMMLSKYSGIVLVFSILLFLIFSPYRRLFRSIHLYLAMGLSIVFFCPVLFWNYQHNWISFTYQLHEHQFAQSANSWLNIPRAILLNFIPVLNYMLNLPFFCWMKSVQNKVPAVYLSWITCLTFLCFYLWVSKDVELHPLWLSQYIITSALLTGFCFQEFPQFRKLISFVINVYWIISIVLMIVEHFNLSSLDYRKNGYYQLMQHFNAAHSHIPDTIVTSNWMTARMLFFLKDKPKFYTLPSCGKENQYALWSKEIAQGIADKSIHEALYIDNDNNLQCIQKYFDKCSLFDKKFLYNRSSHHQSRYGYYAYYCTVS